MGPDRAGVVRDGTRSNEGQGHRLPRVLAGDRDDGGEVTGISGLAAIQPDDRNATFHVEVPNSADLARPVSPRLALFLRAVEQIHSQDSGLKTH